MEYPVGSQAGRFDGSKLCGNAGIGASPNSGIAWFVAVDPNERDIIVIGASAGGVEALMSLFFHLPRNLQASLFVVLHSRPFEDSRLPEILSRAGSFEVSHPKNGEPIRRGVAYVAPRALHMVLNDGTVSLNTAPKESGTRPAINPLFRSAALAYGPRVIGVVLTGALDDGTAGLWEIKRRGGLALVQSPEDALFPGMPRSAIANVPVDHVVPIREMGDLLVKLCMCEERT